MALRTAPKPPPTRLQKKRAQLVSAIADVFLTDGVADLPLRDLAARLGTSDRMLLYYFEDKAALTEAAIAELETRLAARLAAARKPGARHPPRAAMREFAAAMASPEVLPFRPVWTDVLARGGRGEAPFQAIGRRLVAGALADIDARLTVFDAKTRRQTAGAILAAVEGAWLIGKVAPGSADEAMELLARGLAPH